MAATGASKRARMGEGDMCCVNVPKVRPAMPPVPMDHPSIGSAQMDALVAARDALAQGKRAVVVTVRAVEGAAPSREGMAFALVEGGSTFGTLGCDGFDRAAQDDASRA